MFVIEYTSDKDFAERSKRPAAKTDDIIPIVKDVLCQVRQYGDKAVRELTMKFDKSCPDSLQASQEEIDAAENEVPENLKEAIAIAKSNIEKFHKSQIPAERKLVETSKGIVCWQKSVGIEKIGIYIPGGSAPLFSTVLMLETILPADELLELLQVTEAGAGRDYAKGKEECVLDADLLLYDDMISSDEHLLLPHPEIAKRAYVLKGLCETVPKMIHPVLKKTMEELGKELNA